MRTILFLLIIISFSCNGRRETNSNDFEFYPQIPDSLNKEGFLTQTDNSIFNLPALFKGAQDSLEIRIWPSGAFDLWREVFVFKIGNTGWHGYHYFSYTIPIIDQEGKTMIFSDAKKIGDSVFLVKEITPVCGWKKFADSINFFSIKTLPTESLIKNFKLISVRDGGGVTLEIATNKSYRFIAYYNSEIYHYEECKKITAFMKMLERQLGTNYSWPRKLRSNINVSFRN